MMTDKRYTFECNGNNCLIYEDGVWLKIEEVVDKLNEQQSTITALKEENEELKQQLVDVTKSIDSLCNRVDKSNRSNEFKWGAIMGLRTLQRELKGDGV